MLHHRRLFASIAATALVVCTAPEAGAYCRSTTCTGDCPRDADGCKTSGKPLAWPSGCVGFSLQQDSSVHIPMKYFREVSQRSFVAWTELECDTGLSTLSFSELDEVACNKTEYNTGGTNANIILFQDTKWDYKGTDNTLAKTTVTFNDDTGEILDADIEINHAYNEFTINDTTVKYDLQSVLTHEIGHFVGIDHTPDFTATMYAGYEPGTIEQRTLELDDVAVACAIYPPERDVVCDPEPRGGLGFECGGEANPDDADKQPLPGCSAARAGGDFATPLGGLAGLAALVAVGASRRRARARSRRG